MMARIPDLKVRLTGEVAFATIDRLYDDLKTHEVSEGAMYVIEEWVKTLLVAEQKGDDR